MALPLLGSLLRMQIPRYPSGLLIQWMEREGHLVPTHGQIWGPLLGPTVPLPSEAPLPCGGLLSGGQGSSSDLSGPPDLSPGFQFPLTLRMRLRPLKPSSLHQPLISILLLGSTRSKLS